MATSETPPNNDMPEWVPEEYDPDAPLIERLPIMAEIEGGIELHVQDKKGVVEIVGEPHELHERANGTLKLNAGGREFNWNWEIIVPASDNEAVLQSVNPEQSYEAYEATKRTQGRGIDVRMYGVDADRFGHLDDL